MEGIMKMYKASQKAGLFEIALYGRPVGVYSAAGSILEVIDDFNLPPQICVADIIAAS